MHYYQFNIGDYVKSTRHLTPIEDIAYRRMLDLQYDTEKPLPSELAKIARLISMPLNQEEIRIILNEYWNETDLGWVNFRVEKELDNYKAKADVARANGRKGGRPLKPKANPEETQSVILANPELTQKKANHKPLTNNQETYIKENGSSNEQPLPSELIEKAFEHFWKTWKQCKKDCGVTDTSAKGKTFNSKWKLMFNASYFKKHSLDEFKLEVNKICDFAKDAHKVDGFNSFTNMQTGKFFTNKQWLD